MSRKPCGFAGLEAPVVARMPTGALIELRQMVSAYENPL